MHSLVEIASIFDRPKYSDCVTDSTDRILRYRAASNVLDGWEIESTTDCGGGSRKEIEHF